MTTTEFKNEFNILYDSVASKDSPGFDDYEISIFLTYAQEELIKSKDTPKSNKLKEGFEYSEKRRIDLKELIKDYESTIINSFDKNIETNSKFFNVPNDIFLIKYENATIFDTDCNKNIDVKVVPKTYDEYNVQRKNPFKKPSKEVVWRIDYNSIETNQSIVELISDYQISKYKIRYLKRPNPIIITDLTSGTFTGEGLSISGFTAEKTCELNSFVHPEIVRRAVELASLSQRENTLQNLVNLYNRNE